VESGTVTGPETPLGATPTTPHRRRVDSNGSATSHDIRQCARCGEQNQYCHGHTPVVPNASLDLPPRFPLQASIQPDGVARINLNRTQATALAANLLEALEDHQDAAQVPPAYNYGEEIANIVAEGLGIDREVAAEGLGVRTRGNRRQGRGRGNGPQQIPAARSPTHTQQTQGPRAPRRVTSPVLSRFPLALSPKTKRTRSYTNCESTHVTSGVNTRQTPSNLTGIRTMEITAWQLDALSSRDRRSSGRRGLSRRSGRVDI
jgi:hypothetical protein